MRVLVKSATMPDAITAAPFARPVDAPPGEYRFVCTIPGHVEVGMVGTLTVET